MMALVENDKKILRELAKKVAEIASLPIHQEKIVMWKKLNSLKKVKPMIFINQVPWHEMAVGDELELKTGDDFCRSMEWKLRETIYTWEHMRGDMIIEPFIYSLPVVHDTGIGLRADMDRAVVDEKSNIVSKHYHAIINDEDDVEKIKMPVVTYDSAATEYNHLRMVDMFEGILDVKKKGMGFDAWMWDELIQLMGVEEGLTNMALRPELVHKAMERLTDAHLCRLEQYKKLNLLDLNNGNDVAGSGGLGFTDELPKEGYEPGFVRPADMWSSTAPQIFSSVSPEMHDEFALQYEMRILKHFGLVYYGCCEPLHRKIKILQKIPNLRKVSMSPWINIDEAVENVGNKYVFSYKPNPALLAEDVWNPDNVKAELVNVLEKAERSGCVVEIILKDISTVRNRPQRLWEWAKIAGEICESYGE